MYLKIRIWQCHGNEQIFRNRYFICNVLYLVLYQKSILDNINKHRASKAAVTLKDASKGKMQFALKKIRAPVGNLNICIYKVNDQYVKSSQESPSLPSVFY